MVDENRNGDKNGDMKETYTQRKRREGVAYLKAKLAVERELPDVRRKMYERLKAEFEK